MVLVLQKCNCWLVSFKCIHSWEPRSWCLMSHSCSWSLVPSLFGFCLSENFRHHLNAIYRANILEKRSIVFGIYVSSFINLAQFTNNFNGWLWNISCWTRIIIINDFWFALSGTLFMYVKSGVHVCILPHLVFVCCRDQTFPNRLQFLFIG